MLPPLIKLKKNVVKVGPPLTKLSESGMCTDETVWMHRLVCAFVVCLLATNQFFSRRDPNIYCQVNIRARIIYHLVEYLCAKKKHLLRATFTRVSNTD